VSTGTGCNQGPSPALMGSCCAKESAIDRAEVQVDLRNPPPVLRHAIRAAALAPEDGSSALKRELELLLAALMEPSSLDPHARSKGDAPLPFASMLSLHVDEQAPDERFASMLLQGSRPSDGGDDKQATHERVAFWLRETLVGKSSLSSAITRSARPLWSVRAAPDAPRLPRSRSNRLEIPFLDGESRDDESHDDANPSPSSLWVQPEAMAMALSGELFEKPLTISDSARVDALACLGTWDYDTLALQEASAGHALLLVGEALFEWHKLHEPCHVDRAVLHRFLRALEACYGDHEYHNPMHGADVALGVHHFIVNFGLTARLTKLELLAALVGALVHDFNHPGTNNGHEMRARTERARTHTDAILERHHLHSTFTLLATPGFDLFGAMPADDQELCRKLIVDMVLATDLKMHVDIISTLRTLAAQHGATAAVSAEALRRIQCLDRSNGGERRGRTARVSREVFEDAARGSRDFLESAEWTSPFQAQAHVKVPLLLAVAIKFADLGHCFKPFQMHKKWAQRVTNEFWALGDRERQLGIALSPLCDRDTDSNVPESQIGFFKYICVPFYSIVADLIDPTMLPWLRVEANLQAWGEELEAEKTRAAATVYTDDATPVSVIDAMRQLRASSL
jgi:hypothetical protein